MCGGDLPEVDCMVPGLHLTDYPILQVGERLVEERGPVSPMECVESAMVPFSG